MARLFKVKYVIVFMSACTKGWEILWGGQCEAPASWARAGKGEPGTVIHIWQPDAATTAVSRDDEVPYVRIWLMPIIWEGNSPVLLQRIRDGRITREPNGTLSAKTAEAAAYHGSSLHHLLFYRSNRLGDWRRILSSVAETYGIAGAP